MPAPSFVLLFRISAVQCFLNEHPFTMTILMQRRDFLTSSGAGVAALAAATTVFAADVSAKKEYIEVRKYTVKDTDKRTQLIELCDKALIPALNRQNLKPVGIFIPLEGDEKHALNLFVVIPHSSPESFIKTNMLLLEDETYRKDAAPIFETTSKNPVYTDCVTYFLNTFPSIPVLETPNLGADRVFQLRLYRSFNVERHAAKIKMFDQGGELPLFREVEMNPIFFGDVVAGNRMPCLMYMIGCPSLEKHTEVWRTFGRHPKWREISSNPEYADTATEIDAVILRPSAGSQI